MSKGPCLIFLLSLHPENPIQINMQLQVIGKRHYLTLLSTVFLCCAGLSVSAQPFPYQNPDLSAKERAKDLCSRLTLEEKAMLMLDESPAIPRMGIKKFFWWIQSVLQ